MVKKGGKGKGEKKVVEMTRHWSRFTPKSQFTQNNSYYSCDLSLHKPLWTTQSSFLFLFGWWDKASASLIVVLRFSEPPQFLDTLHWGKLVFQSQTAVYWISGTATSSCTILSSTIGKLNNSISQTSVSSVVFIQPLFVSVSPSVLLRQSHTSLSLSNPHLILFQWILFHSKTLQGCIHFASVIWQKVFLLVLLDWFFAQALLGTSLSLSWWSFMCSSQLTRAAVTLSATKTERETEGDDDKPSQADVPWAVCVTQSQETHHCCQTLPKHLNRRIFIGWFWTINSDLQSCSNHANKRPPFQILVDIPTTAFAHFSWWRVLSSAVRSPWQDIRRKKRRRKNENKNKEMKREKGDFPQWIFFWRTISKEIRKKR